MTPANSYVRSLSPEMIAALDWARAVAATMVLVHHLIQHQELGFVGTVIRVMTFGQEAVMMFFLLSGFTIFASEAKRVSHPLGYYMRRLRRIYPCFLAVILLSTLIAYFQGTLAQKFDFSSLIGTVLGLADQSNKPGILFPIYLEGYNAPLWSIAYELFFYLLFPGVMYFFNRWPLFTNFAIGIACFLSYAAYIVLPNHFLMVGSYFMIWWCGAMSARAYLSGQSAISVLGTVIYGMVALAGLAGANVVYSGFTGFSSYPLVQFRHFLSALLLLAVAYSFIGKHLAALASQHAKTGAYLATLSYGIYIFHQPILSLDFGGILGVALQILLILALAWLFDRMLNRILPKPQF